MRATVAHRLRREHPDRPNPGRKFGGSGKAELLNQPRRKYVAPKERRRLIKDWVKKVSAGKAKG